MYPFYLGDLLSAECYRCKLKNQELGNYSINLFILAKALYQNVNVFINKNQIKQQASAVSK